MLAAGTEILGERVYASLKEIPDKVDMVDIFRASSAVPPIVDDAIAIGAKVVWMQIGVRHDEAAVAGRTDEDDDDAGGVVRELVAGGEAVRAGAGIRQWDGRGAGAGIDRQDMASVVWIIPTRA